MILILVQVQICNVLNSTAECFINLLAIILIERFDHSVTPTSGQWDGIDWPRPVRLIHALVNNISFSSRTTCNRSEWKLPGICGVKSKGRIFVPMVTWYTFSMTLAFLERAISPVKSLLYTTEKLNSKSRVSFGSYDYSAWDTLQTVNLANSYMRVITFFWLQFANLKL